MEQNGFVSQDRIISFDEYIAKKYGGELKQLLHDDLYDGYDGDASIKVSRRTGKVESLYYWQDSEEDISGIIEYSAKCSIEHDGKTDSCVCECFIGLTACLSGDRVDCDFYLFRDDINSVRHRRAYERLDRYLLPKAGTLRVEEICDSILRHYCPEAIKRNKLVDPDDLAAALGLRIKRMPLRSMENKSSLLVTQDMELPTGSEYIAGNTETTYVEHNTIVLNTNYKYYPDNNKNCIAHECYHYAGQKLFNRFQLISHSEYPALGRKPEYNYDESEAYHWLEWQARVGTSFIRYPGSYARDDISEGLERFAPVSAHAGEQFQNMIFSSAHKWGLPAQLVCRTVRYLKHPEAKGACNFVNGEYQRPFAFDPDKCNGPHSYIISFADLLKLYAQNGMLRDAMRNGALVYADAHICANNPAFVYLNDEGRYRLTDHALERVDRCCLRFFIDYSKRNELGYKVGLLSCDDRLITYTSKLADVYGCDTGLIGTTFRAYAEIRALPIRFGDTVKYFREKANMIQLALAVDAGLDEKTVRRIESGETTNVTLSVALRLAYVFKLESVYLSEFLRRAGYIPDASPAGYTLDLIIQQFRTLDREALKIAAEEYDSIRRAATADGGLLKA